MYWMLSLKALICVAHRGKRSQWDKAMAELLCGLGQVGGRRCKCTRVGTAC